jgi:hypothetical protein
MGLALFIPQNYMANDLPALRHGETLRMASTQVVTVWLGAVAQRTKHRHRVSIDIRESGPGFFVAGDLATRALNHSDH